MWELFYSTGEFARLNRINKRTLHYYDEIGLFSPEHKGENGYRYYTCMPFEQLELILLLRRQLTFPFRRSKPIRKALRDGRWNS